MQSRQVQGCTLRASYTGIGRWMGAMLLDALNQFVNRANVLNVQIAPSFATINTFAAGPPDIEHVYSLDNALSLARSSGSRRSLGMPVHRVRSLECWTRH